MVVQLARQDSSRGTVSWILPPGHVPPLNLWKVLLDGDTRLITYVFQREACPWIQCSVTLESDQRYVVAVDKFSKVRV